MESRTLTDKEIAQNVAEFCFRPHHNTAELAIQLLVEALVLPKDCDGYSATTMEEHILKALEYRDWNNMGLRTEDIVDKYPITVEDVETFAKWVSGLGKFGKELEDFLNGIHPINKQFSTEELYRLSCESTGVVLYWNKIIGEKLVKEKLMAKENDGIDVSEEVKLLILNMMEVVDFSCSGGECEYVTVDDNQENRRLLHAMNLTDEVIDGYVMDDTIDISMIAWEYTDVNYWSKKMGFHYEW